MSLRFLALLLALPLGCAPDPDPVDACADVDCGDHGACVGGGGVAQCWCDDGYSPDGLSCVSCADARPGDIDIPFFTPTVLSSVGGELAPATAYDQGEEWAYDLDHGDSALLALSALGEVRTALLPGEYTLGWASIATHGQTPGNSAAYVGEASVWSDDPLLVDTPVATLTGALRVNGATAPPSPYDYGLVVLVDPVTGGEVPLGYTLSPTYEAQVVPGAYEVHYRAEVTGEVLPANEDAVLGSVDVAAGGGTLDVDIPAVRWSGGYRVDGATAPASAYDQARVWLQGAGEDRVTVGDSSTGAFAITLVPGTYGVRFDHLAGESFPRNQAGVAGDVSVTTDLDQDVEIEGRDVAITLTLDGAAFPTAALEYGAVNVLDAVSGQRTLLGYTNGGASIATRLAPGTYTVEYDYGYGHVVPANHLASLGTLDTSSPRFSRDIASTALSGAFLLNGAPAPPSVLETADITLTSEDVGRVDLGATALQAHDVRVIEGTYVVGYHFALGHELPANRDGALATIVVSGDAQVEDVSIVPNGVSGAFLVNGAPAPASVLEYGDVYLVDPDTGDELLLGRTALGSYDASVLPGTYEVYYRWGAGGAAVPVNRNGRVGCFTVERPLAGQ